MKYYTELVKKQVFSKHDLFLLMKNKSTVDSFILQAQKSGILKRIRHNYYTLISLDTNDILPSRYIIGCNIQSKSFLSHHSAFEYYGMMNQVYETIFVSSSIRFPTFEFDGITYRHVQTNKGFGIHEDGLIRVTDLERTLLDCLKDLNHFIGLEELMECLSFITVIDEKKLLEYLPKYNNVFLYQKAGYILSHFPSMKLSKDFFDTCRKHIQKSVRYLYNGVQYEDNFFDSSWQIILPTSIRASERRKYRPYEAIQRRAK